MTKKTFHALVSQTFTNAPTVTVLENTLGGPLTSEYYDTGLYGLTRAAGFDPAKTQVFIGSPFFDYQAGISPYDFQACVADNGQIAIATASRGVGCQDNLLLNTSILIYVFE